MRRSPPSRSLLFTTAIPSVLSASVRRVSMRFLRLAMSTLTGGGLPGPIGLSNTARPRGSIG